VSGPLRLGGIGRLAGGQRVVWSVAEGARGRRWRATVDAPDGGLSISVLYELDLEGRPAKLEVASRAGLLSVHPEPDNRLHGNVVSGAGVRAVQLRWSDEHGALVAGLPITTAALCHRLASSVQPGETAEPRIAEIDEELRVTARVATVERLTATRWLVDGPEIELDERGVPILLEAAEWALEDDAEH